MPPMTMADRARGGQIRHVINKREWDPTRSPHHKTKWRKWARASERRAWKREAAETGQNS